MPIYDYKCDSCDNFVSISRGIADREVVPECLGCQKPLNRVYSSVGVTFSGSGFYSTDKGK
jgi:putative FmdB family regulatory protein